MKYEVLDSVLLGAKKSFNRGDTVTAADLTDAGFDVEFLLKNKSIEVMRGTESYDEDLAETAKGGKGGKAADPFAAGRKPLGPIAPNGGGASPAGKS